MAIINESVEQEYGLSLGIDTTSQPANTAGGYMRIARNCNLDLTAGWIKRDGYENQLASSWGAFGVIGGVSYQRSGELAQTVLYNTVGELADLTSGTAVSIQTGFENAVKPSIFQFGELLFFYNGEDEPILYDGTAPRQIGIDAPTTAPTKNSEIAGDLNTGASDAYVYVQTYYNSVTKAESSPSPSLSGVQTSLGGIRLDITPGDSTTADKIRIYRTVANGSQPILDGEADIADTTYDSIVADEVLGVAFNNRFLEFDNSRIYDLAPTAKYAIVADNRVFLKTGTNELRFSKIGQSGPMPESFEVEASVNCESRYGASDPVVGLGQIKDRVIVLKQRSVGFLEPVGINVGTDPVDEVQYIYREISDTTGAISHFGGTQVYGEYVFLGRDNVYATDGVNLREVGNSIQDTVRAMGFDETEIDRISAINDTKYKRIYIAGFEFSGDSEPRFILVGDYQRYPDFRWTTYTRGTDENTHPGLNVGAFWTAQNTDDGSLDVFFGDSRNVGTYHKMNSGKNDDGDGIYFEIVTRGYSHGQPHLEKLFKDLSILGRADTPFYNLQVCYRIDFSRQDKCCFSLPLPVDGGQWETVAPQIYNWADEDPDNNDVNTLIWAGDIIDTVEVDAHLKGKHIQYVFRQTDADAPITLISWSSIASLMRRK